MKSTLSISLSLLGAYHIILDEKHCKDLLLEHVRPQESTVSEHRMPENKYSYIIL